MTKQELFNIKAEAVSADCYLKAKVHWDTIAKPIDGLGDFESLICTIAAIQRTENPSTDKRVLTVFCSDNGIVSEGVSQSGQEVTKQVAISLGSGLSSAACIAKSCRTKVLGVDIGINCSDSIPGILNRKIMYGTQNFLLEPAMNCEQLLSAIGTGIDTVKKLKQDGVDIIATGEMGIGNTTTSAAVLGALLNLDGDAITGRGAGLDDDKLNRKKQVIADGIEKYTPFFSKIVDEKERAFEILRCLGGLDIAAMCGVYIGCAIYSVPVIVDGAISSTAALCAQKIVPGVAQYMIASHEGRENINQIALNELGLKAYIKGNMALGEGTGALMLIPLIDAALHFYNNGQRFDGMGVVQYERYN